MSNRIADPALRRMATANTIAKEPKLSTIQEAFEKRDRVGK